MIKAVGLAPSAAPGEHVRCQGEWTVDEKFGRQFRADQIVATPPATADAIEKYLASGMIAGVGPSYAKKLISMFGADLPRVIEQNPSYLDAVDGIGPARRRRIVESWNQQRGGRDVRVFLQELGLGPQRTHQVQQRYGDDSINVIRANPYRLADDISGIGFATADEIAQRLGIGREDPKRIEAGLRATMHRQRLDGHCAVEEATLIKRTAKLLEIPTDLVATVLDSLVEARRLIREKTASHTLIYTPAMRAAEIAVAAHIQRLLTGPVPWGRLDIEQEIANAEAVTGLTLSASQREGLVQILAHKVSVITGPPGTGKSTLVRVLIAIVATRLRALSLAAPLARVASALTKSTGYEAKTIERLLRISPASGEFARNAEQPLDAQLLLVEEMSLVDVLRTKALLEALADDCALILIGDVDQLPSIGPGQVLRDLIDSKVVHTVRLTEVHRQAANSNITYNVHRINRRLAPHIDEDRKKDFEWVIENDAQKIPARVADLVCNELPTQYGFDSIRDVQVLSPMHRGALGVARLNQHLQRWLNPSPPQRIVVSGTQFGIGDRVMHLVNNLEAGVNNGDTGFVEAIDEAQQVISVNYYGQQLRYEADQFDELQLSYAATPHKVQGSEFPAAVVVLTMEHYILLSKALVYSALSRGCQHVKLVGEERALHAALNAIGRELRTTGLRDRLRNAMSISHAA